MVRWAMVIDLKKCTGCGTCVVSCKAENMVPAGILWNKIYDYEIGTYPNVSRHFLPTPCMHCKNPVCVKVCPTGASQQRSDGIVHIDSAKCVGCCYCIMACPYQSRDIQEKESHFYKAGAIPPENLPAEVRSEHKKHEIGVVSKCTFCMDRIDAGIKKGKKPGVDPEASPMCTVTCPVIARYFGDLEDPNSEVSRLIASRRGVQLHPEHGTEPQVYYLQE
jgi:phenylacetyl-CoA:acceptor oxidoreductase subunit 1